MLTDKTARLSLYFLVLTVAAALLLWRWPSTRFDASVLSMLPHHSVKALPQALESGLLERLERQVIVVLGGPQVSVTEARALSHELEASSYFAQVQGELSADLLRAYAQTLYQYRHAFVTSDLLAALKQGTRNRYVLAQLFSPFAGVSAAEIINDPFLVVRNFQLAQLNNNHSKLHLQDGFLQAQDEHGNSYYFIRAELKHAAFSLDANAKIANFFQHLTQEYQDQGLTLLTRGTVFYSHAAAQQAQHDVTLLGSITVCLVLALIMAIFRSPLPVALVLISSATGALTALAATIIIFGGIHLITLTLAVSIVGVSVDYSLYYLTARLAAPPSKSPLDTLQQVQPAILWALVATLISYAALAVAPFPGIRQMAVFAVFGLSGACLTVLCLHPILATYLKPRPLQGRKLLQRCINFYTQRRLRRNALPLILLALGAIGLTRFQAQDDVSAFQQLPEQLLAADQRITALTGQSPEQKWLCVFAPSSAQVLSGLEQIRPVLNKAQQDGLISSYQTMPLTSAQTQLEQSAALNAALPQLATELRAAGLEQELTAYPDSVLSLEDYLHSPLALGFELLCLEQDGMWGILIALHDITDGATLEQQVNAALQAPTSTTMASTATATDTATSTSTATATASATDIATVTTITTTTATAQIALIDRKAAFDELFAFYREVISWALFGAVLVITLGFVVAKGLKQGLFELMPALISLVFAVGASSLLGFAFTFFSLLSLVLVLGIGLNYALFFTKTAAAADTTMLAVTLAMLTTLLTLGVLVFSHTAVIRSFGVTLVCGLSCAFILAPLLIKLGAHDES